MRMIPYPRRFAFLLLGILSFGFSCDPPDNKAAPVVPVTFAVFGNTGLAGDNGLAFGGLIAAVNRSGAEFAADLGNRLPTGAPSGGAEVLWRAVDRDYEKFTIPVYPVAGTNDIFDVHSDGAYTDRYGPPWYSFRRGGTVFAAIHTGDESYRHGLGTAPRLGSEQTAWLRELARKAGSSPLVLLMHHPLWNDAPEVWRGELLPAIRPAKAVLALACYPEGLCDWGTVDGVRVVTTGCAGPVAHAGVGVFPHALLVTVNGTSIGFRTLLLDGTARDGIPVTRETRAEVDRLIQSLRLPSLEADRQWRIGRTIDLKAVNRLADRVSGELSFRTFEGAAWTVQPGQNTLDLEPGASSALHLDVRGIPPELGPQPVYHVRLEVGGVAVIDREETISVKIPPPRTGPPVPVEARVAGRVPWASDGSSVRIPVDVEGADTCGRLVIYREEGADVPVCLHISNLQDFRPGVNEFIWNGRDLEGNRVSTGSLTYSVYVYNKKAPATWVAEGPPGVSGAFAVERGPGGLLGITHSDRSLLEYRIGGSLGEPRAEAVGDLEDLLGGSVPVGMARDGDRRIFVTAPSGVAAAYTTGGKLRADIVFAEEGFLRLTEYRGRSVGGPACGGGKLYVALGGGVGRGPSVLVADGASGRIEREIDLTEYYGESPEPPSVAADESGFCVAHPSEDLILRIAPEGDILWINESGDDIGDRDADGRTFIHGIGLDRFGNTYVNSPGTSARCGVIGPDGRGLFRVIQVQLPGLRVSSVWPMIEGKPSDGLYFVTRGGDRPYVFHIPFTIRRGEIVRGGGAPSLPAR